MKKVVVFGGAGFLGSYLVEELAARGYETIVCDILEENPFEHDLITYQRCDIMNTIEVDSIINENIEIVYNLAGFANLEKAIHNPFETMELNVLGNINILNAIRKQNVSRFVYASSAYAMNKKGSFYGISKLTSEKMVEEFNKRYGLSYTILRYGSVYSELDFDNNYIYHLVAKAIKTGKIEHEGDGKEVREYIHAHDAAILSVDVIQSESFVNKQIVLTGAERMKRIELFKMIREILGKDLDICLNGGGYEHHYKYTPYSFEPSLSKKLIANPHIDMGQGLLRCIKAVYNNDK
ncbi:MAG: UDP-glucose 4-epimerase [Balneola sp.]|nr:UDP-glucose 4-epimerase [Balneola sp.]|tara:strand:+ start:19881 stop:20762 length:882 start_codon:yes stop_codon:yes gene_type:complete